MKREEKKKYRKIWDEQFKSGGLDGQKHKVIFKSIANLDENGNK